MGANIIRLFAEIDRENDRAFQLLARARKILELPVADTFLGRRTQRPFPQERRPTMVVYVIEARKPYRSTILEPTGEPGKR
jgi:hypothetical protein